MSTWFVGARTSSRSCERCVACAVPPVGNRKTLVDGTVVVLKGSWRVPAVDVAPVSLIARELCC